MKNEKKNKLSELWQEARPWLAIWCASLRVKIMIFAFGKISLS